MKRTEILVSGFGGQGVVRLGQIFSTAAVYAGLHTTMLVSHGTETRGGYVRTQIVIDDAPIDSPVVEAPDYFCALSRSAYAKFNALVKDGVILYDPGFVERDPAVKAEHAALPARDLAISNLQRELFANIIFLGVLARLFRTVIPKDAFLQALNERVPKLLAENQRAFELGFQTNVSAAR